MSEANGNGYQLFFTYNDEGIRTSKTVNDVVHTYRLNGNQIVAEEWTTTDVNGAAVSHVLVYLYDAEGAPVGMQYRNQTYAAEVFDVYWYEKNLQGDIVAVYDNDGTPLIFYHYDAWGNVKMNADNCPTASHAHLNPFRYRGYYYDVELGMYYLQSRYYDPAICRFINADDISCLSANGDFASYNLYAYCGNNPVSRADEGGEFWHVVIGAVLGAAANFAISVVSDMIFGEEQIDWTGAVVSAGVGFVTGGLSAMGVPAGVLIGVNAGLSAAESVYSDISDNMSGKENYSTGDIIAHATINAGVSALFTVAGVSSDDVNLNSLYKSSRAAKKALSAKGLAPAVKKGLKRAASSYSKKLGGFTVDCLVDALVVSPITTFTSWYANEHYNIFT